MLQQLAWQAREARFIEVLHWGQLSPLGSQLRRDLEQHLVSHVLQLWLGGGGRQRRKLPQLLVNGAEVTRCQLVAVVLVLLGLVLVEALSASALLPPLGATSGVCVGKRLSAGCRSRCKYYYCH